MKNDPVIQENKNLKLEVDEKEDEIRSLKLKV